jgi:hypothetical protein
MLSILDPKARLAVERNRQLAPGEEPTIDVSPVRDHESRGFRAAFRPFTYGIVQLQSTGGENSPGPELKQVKPILQEEQI